MSAPEPPPAGIAGFRIAFPLQEGRHEFHPAFDEVSHEHALLMQGSWLVSVAPEFGGSFRPVNVIEESADEPGSLASISISEPALSLFGMPLSESASRGGVADVGEPAAFSVPSACNSWMPAPAAQAAERWIDFAFASPIAAQPVQRMPRFELASFSGITGTAAPAAHSAPPACDSWMPAPAAQAAERWIDFAFASPIAAAPVQRMPRFELASLDGITGIEEAVAHAVPPACDSWMPMPAAQAAERWIDFAFASPIAAEPAQHMPQMTALAIGSTYVRRVSLLAYGLDAEPVAVDVFAKMNSEPLLCTTDPAMLRFGMHTVDELANCETAAADPIPEMAGAVEGLAPAPVESMPAVPAFVAAAIASAPELRLPDTATLLRRPLTPAGSVQGPAAMPVESMPSTSLAVPVPILSRMALRRPTLANFQPVQESAEGLAAPVSAPGPVAAESRPAVEVFAAAPVVAPAAAAMLDRPLQAARAQLTEMGFREGASPRIEEPASRQDDKAKAVLEPITRIEAQPAGAQPERPRPEIPQPGMIALEYYCQRITSKPASHPEWMAPQTAVRLAEFAVQPAHKRFEEYDAGRKRKLLPIEEIFAHTRKNDAQGKKRLHLGHAGKIAAAIMVGLALWGGSRIAGLAQHAQQLRATVEASERSVEVADAKHALPQGNGPVAKMRRAIANRAATEITDTFTKGMEAWGAENKKYAPGWSHSADGYVRTGEMALFKPSQTYSDYKMEFYGQIEEKSMGWVVRAQDKKNYYAMKFKIVEPGLRPIIAMVHYQVTNGKPGHVVETPLAVMVHNNQPYHVSVDVRGNHFMAAIEGEPVESWTDESPARGSVGFFSEAGERARLYWMKLSRNQDWLGRMCAYLSGDATTGGAQTAELWGPEIPPRKPEPVNPRTPDAALALGFPGWTGWERPLRAGTSENRRS